MAPRCRGKGERGRARKQRGARAAAYRGMKTRGRYARSVSCTQQHGTGGHQKCLRSECVVHAVATEPNRAASARVAGRGGNRQLPQRGRVGS
jgi:hypothetical protein